MDSIKEGISIQLSDELELNVQERLIKRGIAILGMRGSGKSYTCGVIAEELAKIGQPFIIVDLMGEYYTLREKFPVLIVGLEETDYTDIAGLKPKHAKPLAEFIVKKGLSVVLDLSRGTMAEKLAFLAEFLEAFYKVEEVEKRPYVLIVDEVHRIAPERGLPRLEEVSEAGKRAYYWLYELAATGRHYGIGLVLAARRPAEVSKAILTQAEVRIVHKLVDPADLRRLHEEGLPSELYDNVKSLKPGEALVLGLGEPFFIKVKERLCTHGGTTPLLKPVENPDLKEAIAELARALGLGPAAPKLSVPELEKTPEAEPIPDIRIAEIDYPADIVANYLARMMIYGGFDRLVPRASQRLKWASFSAPDVHDLLRKLARELASEGWTLEKASGDGREFLLASRKEICLGLAAAEARGEGVLTMVLSSPSTASLDKTMNEIRSMLKRLCPDAEGLKQ